LRENHGLHRVRHDIDENNCGHVIREDSRDEVYIAYSRMMRAGPSSSALPCFKTDISHTVSCSCDTPDDPIQNHFTCTDPSRSAYCAAGIACAMEAGETWELSPHVCGPQPSGCQQQELAAKPWLWRKYGECVVDEHSMHGDDLSYSNGVSRLAPPKARDRNYLTYPGNWEDAAL
jgi:hypothetical protein